MRCGGARSSSGGRAGRPRDSRDQARHQFRHRARIDLGARRRVAPSTTPLREDAAATPDAQPSALPPSGGSSCVASMPAVISNHDTREFESDMPRRTRECSRPRRIAGAAPTRRERDSASICADRERYRASRRPTPGWDVASDPAAHSYGEDRDLPGQRIPTGPVATTPRWATGNSPCGAIFDEVAHVTDEHLERRA